MAGGLGGEFSGAIGGGIGGVERRVVSRSKYPLLYAAARKATWGGDWPADQRPFLRLPKPDPGADGGLDVARWEQALREAGWPVEQMSIEVGLSSEGEGGDEGRRGEEGRGDRQGGYYYDDEEGDGEEGFEFEFDDDEFDGEEDDFNEDYYEGDPEVRRRIESLDAESSELDDEIARLMAAAEAASKKRPPGGR